MSLQKVLNDLMSPNPWIAYSKKLVLKIEHPKSVGFFTEEDASSKQMRLVISQEGTLQEGQCLIFYFLIDESDGVIADVKFQVFGDAILIGAAECASELLLRKNYDQARRMTADLIDKHVRDTPQIQAFPNHAASHLNRVLLAIDKAFEQCMDIPFAQTYTAPPMSLQADDGQTTFMYPNWKELSVEQKIAVIEEVIANEIRPYIELDAGGVQVLNVREDQEVIIAYEGACTSCYSATGATLDAIQQILRAKVHPELFVTPDASFLQS